MADCHTPKPVLHPAMAEVYHRQVNQLADALNDDRNRAEAAELLRGLIETIELRPEGTGFAILLRGDLAGILSLSLGRTSKKSPPPGRVTGFCK